MEKLLYPASDPRNLSPLTLAFIGDGVYGLLVREVLILRGNCPAGKLHRHTVEKVNAAAQAVAAERIMSALTPEEEAVFLRGRNAHVTHTPKNVSVQEYHIATGLEALFGYLYLRGELERLKELFVLGDGVTE